MSSPPDAEGVSSKPHPTPTEVPDVDALRKETLPHYADKMPDPVFFKDCEHRFQAVGAHRAETVILDVTGASTLDAAVAELLVRAMRAVALLGVSEHPGGIAVGTALAVWLGPPPAPDPSVQSYRTRLLPRVRTSKRSSGQECRMRARGIQRPASRRIRSHVVPSR